MHIRMMWKSKQVLPIQFPLSPFVFSTSEEKEQTTRNKERHKEEIYKTLFTSFLNNWNYFRENEKTHTKKQNHYKFQQLQICSL